MPMTRNLPGPCDPSRDAGGDRPSSPPNHPRRRWPLVVMDEILGWLCVLSLPAGIVISLVASFATYVRLAARGPNTKRGRHDRDKTSSGDQPKSGS